MSGTWQLDLESFSFPPGWPDNRANFRFVVDVRFVNADGDFEHAVMPSLDASWECDRNRAGKDPQYVRAAAAPECEMNPIDAWDRLILVVKARSVHSVQVKAFVVNREDTWDKAKEALGSLVQALAGKAKGLVSGLPGMGRLVSPALGAAADDVSSSLLKRLANGNAAVLFRGSTQLQGLPAACRSGS